MQGTGSGEFRVLEVFRVCEFEDGVVGSESFDNSIELYT